MARPEYFHNELFFEYAMQRWHDTRPLQHTKHRGYPRESKRRCLGKEKRKGGHVLPFDDDDDDNDDGDDDDDNDDGDDEDEDDGEE